MCGVRGVVDVTLRFPPPGVGNHSASSTAAAIAAAFSLASRSGENCGSAEAGADHHEPHPPPPPPPLPLLSTVADGVGAGAAGAPHHEPMPARAGTATLVAGAAMVTEGAEGAADGEEPKRLKSEGAGGSAMTGGAASSSVLALLAMVAGGGEMDRWRRGESVGDELRRSGHNPPAFQVARGLVTTRVEEEEANWLAKRAEGMVEPLRARPGRQFGHLSPRAAARAVGSSRGGTEEEERAAGEERAVVEEVVGRERSGEVVEVVDPSPSVLRPEEGGEVR